MQDESYGIVPLRKKSGQWEVFLVKHRQGHWAMPKGHKEEGEGPYDAAVRELFEETNLTVVRLLSDELIEEKYTFKQDNTLIFKTVKYFVAEVAGSEKIQLDELKDGKWAHFHEAEKLVTFQQAKNILQKVQKIIQN
jgi:8-oxo-dGTP pyrophosphatase MutT (NUDIX family)